MHSQTSKNPAVVVVGSCNIDLVCYTNRMPVPGETLTGNSFKICNGGKGANQAVFASRIGTDVTMVAKLGYDPFANLYMYELSKSHIDTSNILFSDTASTGTAMIIVTEQGENIIILTPGSNNELSVEDIETKLPALINTHTCQVLVTQMEVPRATTLKALKMAREAGVCTIFNCAPAYSDIDKEFFQLSDILCVNESEAAILTGFEFKPGDDDVEKLVMKKLLKLGDGKCVILTLGSLGARMMHHSNTDLVYSASIPSTFSASDVKDTTGAGDAFIGSLAHLLVENNIKGKSLESVLDNKILEKCVKASSLTVLKEGAQTSYPFKDELPADIFL